MSARSSTTTAVEALKPSCAIWSRLLDLQQKKNRYLATPTLLLNGIGSGDCHKEFGIGDGTVRIYREWNKVYNQDKKKKRIAPVFKIVEAALFLNLQPNFSDLGQSHFKSPAAATIGCGSAGVGSGSRGVSGGRRRGYMVVSSSNDNSGSDGSEGDEG